MARAFKIEKSRKDIYTTGKTVEYVSQKGKRKGQTLKRVDHTQPAGSKDTVLIPKGSTYWYWQFKNGPVKYSTTPPKRSQLTQSNFLQQLYDLDDEINAFTGDYNTTSEDLEAQISEWTSTMEEMRDQCQESHDNLPQGLQDSSPVGEMLQGRIDGLDQWISDLEGTDCDWDEDEMKREAEAAWDQLHPQALIDDDPLIMENKDKEVEEIFHTLIEEKVAEIIESIQSSSPGIE